MSSYVDYFKTHFCVWVSRVWEILGWIRSDLGGADLGSTSATFKVAGAKIREGTWPHVRFLMRNVVGMALGIPGFQSKVQVNVLPGLWIVLRM